MKFAAKIIVSIFIMTIVMVILAIAIDLVTTGFITRGWLYVVTANIVFALGVLSLVMAADVMRSFGLPQHWKVAAFACGAGLAAMLTIGMAFVSI